ncbi:MAG: OadG family transporter subunit [Tannerellaceae bacterium]
MINKKIGVLLLFALLSTFGAKAQLATAARLNEVLVINQDNFVDDYGKCHPWIEIFNSSAGTIDLRGCYITNDKNNPKKYPIPKGDVLTKIKPGQHQLFWADNQPDRGNFHVNFELNPNDENYLAIYDSDGSTLIDEITIPAGQVADVSYGRPVDGKGPSGKLADGEDKYRGGEDSWMQLTKVTPSTNNFTLDKNSKIENFKENDSWGIGMTITAMAVTFLGLFLLYFIFKQVGALAIKASKRNARIASGNAEVLPSAGQESGELFAAIATAIYEVTEDEHDMENTVLTIHKVTRNYSPWSSKIYGLRETPKK